MDACERRLRTKKIARFFLFFLFGECFLEALGGQGLQCQGGRVAEPVSGCLGPAPGDGEGRTFFPSFLASAVWRPWRDGDPSAREAGQQDQWVGVWDRCLRTSNIAHFPLFFFWWVLFGNLQRTGTLVLGRQGSRNSERVPGTGT